MLGAVLEGRYRIDAPIARGGMSAVYLGVDLRLGRDVAVKVMDSRYSGDPQFLRRFEFEARAVAGLKHPGLVAVYDQGIDDGVAFLVMELVDGGDVALRVPESGGGPAVLVRNLYLSCDPYMRGRMRDFQDSYIPPFKPGSVSALSSSKSFPPFRRGAVGS